MTFQRPAARLIAFACVHNVGRSQMAAAFFSTLADSAKATAAPAGTEPATHVHSEVVQAMRQIALDLTGARPGQLTEELAASALLLVGCSEACGAVSGPARDDWPFPVAKGQLPRVSARSGTRSRRAYSISSRRGAACVGER